MGLPRRNKTGSRNFAEEGARFKDGSPQQSTAYLSQDHEFAGHHQSPFEEKSAAEYSESSAGLTDPLQARSGRMPATSGRPRSLRQSDVLGPDVEEDAGWDVYADFNNVGPRYSGAANLGGIASNRNESYRKLDSSGGSHLGMEDEPAVELVTVPRFGPEWTRDELRGMTRKGRAEDEAYERRQRWKEWNHGGRGILGRHWLTRRFIVWTMFFTVVLVVVILAITLPRVPSFTFNLSNPLSLAGGKPVFQSGPLATFAFNGTLNMQMDTGGNVIPPYFSSIDAKVYLSETNALIGEGSTGGFYRKPGASQPLNLFTQFSFSSDNVTDATWYSVLNACKNRTFFSDGNRPGLDFNVIFKLGLRGFIGKKTTSTSIGNVACPFELPESSV